MPAAGVPGVEVERHSRPPWSAGTGRRAATSMRRRSAVTGSRASVRVQHPCALLPQGLAQHFHEMFVLRAVPASQSMARMPGTSSRMSVRASMRASQRGASRMHHGRRDGGPDHRVCLPRQCFLAECSGTCLSQRLCMRLEERACTRDQHKAPLQGRCTHSGQHKLSNALPPPANLAGVRRGWQGPHAQVDAGPAGAAGGARRAA